MSKLGLLDQLFYKLETGGMSPLYMGGAMILDPTDSPYPIDGKILADHLAARMEKIPLMRQKLVQDKLKLGDMRLVDDPNFDVKNHITRTSLKAPGGYKELTECLGEFSAQHLDLTRPLWHYEIIEGLENGRFAIALHIHHSIIDGIGAQQALGSIWSTKPIKPEKPSGKAWQVEEEPTSFELIRGALAENAERLYVKMPAFLMKSGAPLLKATFKTLTNTLRQDTEVIDEDSVTVPKVQKTSINVAQLSPKRAVSYIELPLKDIKDIRSHFNCTINDLSLLLNSYALEHYFKETGEELDFDLVAGMPINTRQEGDESVGNVLSVSRLSLHNQISDLEKRLAAIQQDTTKIKRASGPKAKETSSAIDGKAIAGMVSPIVLDTLIYSIVKLNLLDKASAANVGITNVPGSPVPVYFSGAKQTGTVPMAPVGDTMGLTVTISSTSDLLVIGYHGCGQAIKDKELFPQGVQIAFDKLKSMSKPKRKKAATPKSPAAKTKAKPKAKAKAKAKR